MGCGIGRWIVRGRWVGVSWTGRLSQSEAYDKIMPIDVIEKLAE